ncbi:MAG: ABC transporter ATP-binding protein [Tissierellaceae bacterium]|nr:ABC transporter ATP-binding protein [Tissierellaceae bacterium]
MNALEVKKLEFGYRDNLVIRDISFSIKAGSFVSIIGPNGSGKSTLLKTLNQIYKPSKGQILLYEKDISSYKKREVAKKIALVPQDTNIDYEFTAEDIVMMGRHPHKNRFEGEDELDYKIINESLKLTNTLDLKDRAINQISGGERQRVFIAKALAQKPSIILLDEPTSNLDINHQMDILNLLKRLNIETGLTVVLVIHDINMACRYSDEIILLHKGKILGNGTPEEVITIENMEDAYDMKVALEKNKYTDTIHLTPIEIKKKSNNFKYNNIHIVCGGGSGQEIINKLYQEGFELSLGVLNAGDSDWEHGRNLNITMVEEIPFSGISDETHQKNIKLMNKSDIVVISNVPIGTGNLKNLVAAKHALENGKKVYYLADNTMDFDYTNGEAKQIIDQMKDQGMICIESVDDLLDKIKIDNNYHNH